MTFIYNMASLFTANIVPLILIMPILVAIAAGAVLEITIMAGVPIGLYSAGGTISVVVNTWRGIGAGQQDQAHESLGSPTRRELPSDTNDTPS